MTLIKIVADQHIPFLKGVLEPFGTVAYLPGRKITPEDVRDADAMLIRTRTRCDRRLLEGSRLRFIGSATIGFDHIDGAFCEERGITWCNAPGCNSASVMQYVGSALAHLATNLDLRLESLVLGIVGVGNVGSKVERLARNLGMQVLLNDPPRERREGPGGFVSLEEIVRSADIISLHVPLTLEGSDRTHHLCNEAFFAALEKGPLLINTSRGEAIETKAIKRALSGKKIGGAVVDVWEDEPQIDRELLEEADIATPHIAGYSVDGKARATSMIVRALSRFFGLGLDEWHPTALPQAHSPVIDKVAAGSAVDVVLSCIESTYRVEFDSRRLKESPDTFEEQRSAYPVRREFSSYIVNSPGAWEKAGRQLEDLGFKKSDDR